MAIKSCMVLNVDPRQSTLSSTQIIDNNQSDRYIVSDCDEELLILVEFADKIHLKNVVLYAPTEQGSKENDTSAPQLVHIYKTNHINFDFENITNLKADRTAKCLTKKLNKGQLIKLDKSAANAIKFKTVQYLIIYIQTNQLDTENTFLNGISFNQTQTSQNHNDAMVEKVVFQMKIHEIQDRTKLHNDDTKVTIE
eukprot:852521_1